jgi:hypothetical protein
MDNRIFIGGVVYTNGGRIRIDVDEVVIAVYKRARIGGNLSEQSRREIAGGYVNRTITLCRYGCYGNCTVLKTGKRCGARIVNAKIRRVQSVIDQAILINHPTV